MLLNFVLNSHYQEAIATLTPSNPTILILSIVGNCTFIDSSFRLNKAQGRFGAVSYFEIGEALFERILMQSSNWDVFRNMEVRDLSLAS